MHALDPEAAEVKASGGVVWRPAPDGGQELVIVHRPRYDDWSLPKGKLDSGESWEDAALREVEEEVGLRCRLGPVGVGGLDLEVDDASHDRRPYTVRPDG